MPSTVIDYLIHDDQQDRETILEELSKLWSLKQERPQLFRDLPYAFDVRPTKMMHTKSKLESYRGPDAETTSFLETSYRDWILEPQTFWFPPTVGSSLANLAPEAQMSRMARRLLCLALFDHRSRRTAGLASCPSDGFYLPNDYAGLNSGEDILQRMLDHGSRYNSLGKHLGRGIVLVLGTDLPESYWTKILPKGETKPAFKTFIRNSTQNEVAALAERYTPLCNTLLQWYLRQLIPSGLSSNTLTPNSEGLMVHLGATTDSPMSYEPLGLTFASDQSLLQCEDAIDSFTTFDESFVGGFEF